jgi:pimeloyl-ACP methyl ester carboxylesterase
MNKLSKHHINQRIQKYYQEVSQENLEPFLLFREQHPFKKTTINDTHWEYLDIGSGSQVILLLTGVLGVPVMDWRHITHFSEKYRIIAPCYPPLSSMKLLVDGIADILRSEGITTAHVWGGSYGGAVAQVFVRRHPALSKKLIVSHSFLPNKESAIRLRKTLRWMRLLPGFLLRMVLKNSLNRLLPEDDEGMTLTIGIFNELMNTRMSRQNILAIFNRTVDYFEMTFKPDDLHSWTGAVLLIMSDNDPSTPEKVRTTFQTLYPGAKTHLFHGTGHATSLLREDEYRAVIESFTTN